MVGLGGLAGLSSGSGVISSIGLAGSGYGAGGFGGGFTSGVVSCHKYSKNTRLIGRIECSLASEKTHISVLTIEAWVETIRTNIDIMDIANVVIHLIEIGFVSFAILQHEGECLSSLTRVPEINKEPISWACNGERLPDTWISYTETINRNIVPSHVLVAVGVQLSLLIRV